MVKTTTAGKERAAVWAARHERYGRINDLIKGGERA